jgi:anti-sigma B factor antagonist
MKIRSREVGEVSILDLQGELKLGGGDEELTEVVEQLLAEGRCAVIFNMRHVPWLDTSGMTALVVAKKRAMKMGGNLKLVKLSPKVVEELKMVRLLEVFDVFDDEAQAIESF